MWSFAKLLLWGFFWFWAWAITLPFKKKHEDNCLTYALKKWDDQGGDNGYLVIRWCRSNKVRWIRWPHFLWLDSSFDRVLEHYVPKEEEDTERTIPKPWFDGRVVYNDPQDHEKFRTNDEDFTEN